MRLEIFSLIQMSVQFDRVADIYDRTREYSSIAMTKVLETLKREFGRSGRVLDAGVGTGRFSMPLQATGLELIGIDISRKMLDKALDKGTQNAIIADARTLPFRDCSFDDALSVHVLHLIKEWDEALGEISRVTKNHLVTIGREGPGRDTSPGEAYQDLLKKFGHHHPHPGLAEPRINEFLKPVKSEFIVQDKGDVKRSLEYLNDRVYSIQWNIPDDLHERIMKELRSQFEGKLEYSNDLYLYKWDTTEIREYLDGYIRND
jgi:ubiquinone/menaquinone biosynthesis C-methylase UbiE